MAGLEGIVFLLEVVQYVTHAHAYTRCLVAVRRTYAFACRAYFVFSLESLVGTVQGAVCRQYEVGAFADMQAFPDVVAGVLQFFRLYIEEVGSYDTAVADNVKRVVVEDA